MLACLLETPSCSPSHLMGRSLPGLPGMGKGQSRALRQQHTFNTLLHSGGPEVLRCVPRQKRSPDLVRVSPWAQLSQGRQLTLQPKEALPPQPPCAWPAAPAQAAALTSPQYSEMNSFFCTASLMKVPQPATSDGASNKCWNQNERKWEELAGTAPHSTQIMEAEESQCPPSIPLLW